jgi:hypothetical protein
MRNAFIAGCLFGLVFVGALGAQPPAAGPGFPGLLPQAEAIPVAMTEELADTGPILPRRRPQFLARRRPRRTWASTTPSMTSERR